VRAGLVPAVANRLRGIRTTTAWHEDPAIRSNPKPPPPGLLSSEAFRQGIRCLAQANLSLDVWAYHTQLDEVTDIARQNPDVSLILDHVGGPLGLGPYAGQRDAVFVDWKADIADLAALPNVTVKLGGLGMKTTGFAFHELPQPPGSDELAEAWRPYIQTCIDLFGPDRCMFESNFPVDKGMFSYLILWNAFKRIVQKFTESEKTALFSGTATRVYRLP